MLRLELEALAEQEFALELTGFDEKELQKLLAQEPPKGSDPDAVPEIPSEPVSQPGNLWILGRHRLLCGGGTRSKDMTLVLDGQPCHLVFTDRPDSLGFGVAPSKMKSAKDRLGSKFDAFLRSACRTTLAVSQGPVYICISSSELHRLHAAFCESGGHWSTYIVWAKNTFTPGRSDYQSQYELILYGWPEGDKHYWCGSRKQGDLWWIGKPLRNDLPPTIKPVELVERAIRNSSRPGDVVCLTLSGAPGRH